MSWNRTKAKVLNQHWSELVEAQRFARAVVLVDYGINEGANITQAADVVGISKSSAQEYIDLYAANEGAGWEGGAEASAPISIASVAQMRALRNKYKDTVEVTPEEVQQYEKDHGYSPEVARRWLESEKIGELAAEDGLITDDGGLDIKPVRSDLPVTTGANSVNGGRGKALDWRKWGNMYDRYRRSQLDFLDFLKKTAQDNMTNGRVEGELRRTAIALDTQADRFGTGYAKNQARKAAQARKKVTG